MGRFGLLAVLGLCLVGDIHGAGYIGKRPSSQGQCHYQNINAAHFSYEINHCEGPSNWCEVHECWSACGSEQRQSPINIDTHQAQREDLANIQLWNKHKRIPADISNNGHSPHFDVHVDKISWFKNIILTNVPFKEDKQFIFAELHIHVGIESETDRSTKNHEYSKSKVNDHEGSEHSIDNKFFPMEGHMVFYDRTYSNFSMAKPVPDSLVVIGVMIKVKDDDDDDYEDDENNKEEEETEEEYVDEEEESHQAFELLYKEIKEILFES
ncbi:nacrein-like protein [Saccostrea echinata]|uniref:nacrein-like protein n=1 Tax=Saccostrea echinata TaxID=191078 RepID=UPI002A80F00D|nr:nacrein-like protein [Saccostrea echinata]